MRVTDDPHQADARLYAERPCAAGLDPLPYNRVEKDEDADDSGYGQPHQRERNLE